MPSIYSCGTLADAEEWFLLQEDSWFLALRLALASYLTCNYLYGSNKNVECWRLGKFCCLKSWFVHPIGTSQMWLPLSTFYISHEALCFGNIGAARKVFPDWFFLTMVIPCFQFLGEAPHEANIQPSWIMKKTWSTKNKSHMRNDDKLTSWVCDSVGEEGT